VSWWVGPFSERIQVIFLVTRAMQVWGASAGCTGGEPKTEMTTILTREGDNTGHHGVVGGGEEANLGFRVGGVRGGGLAGNGILGFVIWEGSPELEV
jgi:hypothetical protein